MKNNLWMLAAILFCSLGSIALTSCGDDDDDNNVKEEKKTNADVRVALVTQRDTYNMFTFDFSLTDPSGKTTNYNFDSSDKSDDKFYECEANSFISGCTFMLIANPQLKEFFENVNIHHFLCKNVPSGSKIDFKTVSHLLKTYEPKEKGNTYLMPGVMVTLVINGEDRPYYLFDLSGNSVDKTIWEKYMSRYDDQPVAGSTKTLEIVY